MMRIELDNETYALLVEVQKSLNGMMNCDTMDSVVRELCNVYYWRYED